MLQTNSLLLLLLLCSWAWQTVLHVIIQYERNSSAVYGIWLIAKTQYWCLYRQVFVSMETPVKTKSMDDRLVTELKVFQQLQNKCFKLVICLVLVSVYEFYELEWQMIHCWKFKNICFLVVHYNHCVKHLYVSFLFISSCV